MPPEKPWQLDLLARLFVAVLICVLSGPALQAFLAYDPAAAKLAPAAFHAMVLGALALSALALVLTLLPWSLDRLQPRITVLCLAFFAQLQLAALAYRGSGAPADPPPSLTPLILTTLLFHGAGLLLIGWFVRRHGLGWSGAFGFSRRTLARALLAGALFTLLAVPAGWMLQTACGLVLKAVHLEPQPQKIVELLKLSASLPAQLYLGMTAIVLAPLAEEILFRGILYTAVKQRGYPRLALWGSALLFGVAHAHAASFLPLVLFGVAQALLYERTTNLLAPVVSHAGFNAANFLMLHLLKAAGHFD